MAKGVINKRSLKLRNGNKELKDGAHVPFGATLDLNLRGSADTPGTAGRHRFTFLIHVIYRKKGVPFPMAKKQPILLKSTDDATVNFTTPEQELTIVSRSVHSLRVMAWANIDDATNVPVGPGNLAEVIVKNIRLKVMK